MELARRPTAAESRLGDDGGGGMDVGMFTGRKFDKNETLHRSTMAQQSLQSSFAEGSAASKIQLPTPKLKVDFRICVQLNPLISVGEGPWGKRNWISFKGGQWKATWGEGTVEVHR